MIKRLTNRLLACLAVMVLAHLGFAADKQISLNIRGVHHTKVTLTPFEGLQMGQPLRVYNEVKPGQTITFDVPDEMLPREFVLQFNFCREADDQAYPSEIKLFLNKENLKIHANPLYLHADSLQLEGDVENVTWQRFNQETGRQRQQIALLEQLLAGYDRSQSAVWKKARKEYLKRAMAYNQWVDSAGTADQHLFVSHLYPFAKINTTDWSLPAEQRQQQLINTWFDPIDLNDSLLLASRQLNQYVGQFVGLLGQQATSAHLRDSLFAQAGRLALEQAATGHPKVYGWMADYFYTGYETYAIDEGLNMLATHINKPNCLTRKKQAVLTRVEGMKRMVAGVQSPILKLKDEEGRNRTIDFSRGKLDYHLLVFYDVECGHCNALLKQLETWYAAPEVQAWIDIYSVSLDEKHEAWAEFHKSKNFAWTDMYAEGGINSQAAEDYYILSAPQMFVMNNDGHLVAKPTSVEALQQVLFGN